MSPWLYVLVSPVSCYRVLKHVGRLAAGSPLKARSGIPLNLSGGLGCAVAAAQLQRNGERGTVRLQCRGHPSSGGMPPSAPQGSVSGRSTADERGRRPCRLELLHTVISRLNECRCLEAKGHAPLHRLSRAGGSAGSPAAPPAQRQRPGHGPGRGWMLLCRASGRFWQRPG
jgi:hypothetical protein